MTFWKKRQPDAPRAPTGLLATLDHYGRFEWDPQNTPLIGDMEFTMYQWFQSDREGFLKQMVEASKKGGWVSYGAERLMVSICGGNLAHPAYDAIMGNALESLRGMGVPAMRLNSWEFQWWSSHRGAW